MNEFGFDIPAVGLQTGANENTGMRTLRGLRVKDGYFEVPAAPIMAASSGQVISGMRGLYLCGFGGMSKLNPATLAVADAVFSGSFGGAYWHVADFGDTIVAAVDGDVMFVMQGKDGPVTGLAPVSFDCCCAHNLTRFIYGSENIVSWGTVMGDDLANILLGVERDRNIVAMGEHGSQALPWTGAMVCIKPLGRAFVVYGEDGISVFQTTDQTYSLLDVPGLPPGVGIGSPGAADGDSLRHVFSGTDGKLYALTPDKCEPLGFEHVFSVADGATRTVAYDPLEEQWWISGAQNEGSYILTKHGLSGPVEPVVLSCCPVGGRAVGTGTGWTEQHVPVEIMTGPLNRKEPGQTRLTYFRYRLDADSTLGPVWSSVRYKTSNTGRWKNAPTVQCSKDGSGFVNRTAHDAMAWLSARLPVRSKLWGLELRYQNSDGRTRRGPTGIESSAE